MRLTFCFFSQPNMFGNYQSANEQGTFFLGGRMHNKEDGFEGRYWGVMGGEKWKEESVAQ